ncbi:CatB-related O-acetyltransferase [Cellulomonas fimi]|uniref:CatB-related O-acetyltransferase n=1 Tax=Cellulomonas fimi TaxID=1708 RepID=UPI00234CE2B9|nr:CatB-related O-acetyltransferase [Cellulomonas fimi]
MLARLLVRFYGPAGPWRRQILALAVRLEGGQMTSGSLRRLLRERYGVVVGPYSYGSLLEPGAADVGTTIGAYVSVGPGVRRFGAAHPLDDLTLHPYFYNPALGLVGAERDVERTPCVIGDDVWIGAGAVILPGCRRIGRGAVVGAGAVLTRDVPDYAVAVGNPARVIRTRLDETTRQRLADVDFAGSSPHELAAILAQIKSQTLRRPRGEADDRRG